MSMRITKSSCTKCGLCQVHCPVGAIRKNDESQYVIDKSLCDGCDGRLEIQCAKLCRMNCIIDSITGEAIHTWDTGTPRLSPDMLLNLVAIMGSGESGRYMHNSEIKRERTIIANAFLNPEMMVNIIGGNTKILRILKLEPRQTINFWDAISMARRCVTPEHLESIGKSDIFIEDFIHSLSPYDIIKRGRPT